MAQRILVALDGTDAGEAMLPVVGDLARGAKATVRLLHVEPWPETVQERDGRVIAYADQRVAAIQTRCENYLALLAGQLGGISVERAIRFGDPLGQVRQEATAWAADLVVVVDPQREGWSQWWHPSLAGQLQGRMGRPVLVYLPSLSGVNHGASGCCPETRADRQHE